MNKLEDILANRLCNGCGACAAMAPGAIKMIETKSEARRPSITKPIGQAKEQQALANCPGANASLPKTNDDITSAAWGPIIEVWEGYATDPEICHKGSSGGAVTALALYCIEKEEFAGALHVKADTKNPILNKASLSTNRTELMVGAGSRYAPASVCDALPEVSSAENSCVVIGKPCDIAGTNSVAASVPELARNLGLTISIFCAGSPSQEGTQALLENLKPADAQTLLSLKYRGEGWPGDMEAVWETKSGARTSATTSYGAGWGNILQKHRQWRCHTCADHTGEFADISVGDPWQNPPETMEHGKSLIVVRTERGRNIMQAAMETGYIKAERRENSVLFAAQPNLFATKGAVWGRSVAMRLIGLAAPKLTLASFKCWLKLPLMAKAQSVLGTLKRVRQKKLYLPQQLVPLNVEPRQ